MRLSHEPQTLTTEVTRRSPLSLRSGLVAVVIVAALLLVGDAVYRNEQAVRLLASVEDAEAVLVSYQRSLSYGEEPDVDEVVAAYQAARDVISAFDVPGFYVALERTRDGYLSHADDWLEALRDPSDEAFNAVNASWETFCSSVGQVVPYLDYGSVDRSVVYLRARGGCPGA